jgi:ELWxxDGT repeat protein
MVKDINVGSGSSFSHLFAHSSKVFNNKLYFSANDGITGYELWSTDGTGTTSMVKDINVGMSNSNPSYSTVCNNKLFFTANDGSTYGTELWVMS